MRINDGSWRRGIKVPPSCGGLSMKLRACIFWIYFVKWQEMTSLYTAYALNHPYSHVCLNRVWSALVWSSQGTLLCVVVVCLSLPVCTVSSVKVEAKWQEVLCDSINKFYSESPHWCPHAGISQGTRDNLCCIMPLVFPELSLTLECKQPSSLGCSATVRPEGKIVDRKCLWVDLTSNQSWWGLVPFHISS